MICGGFLSAAARGELRALARDGRSEARFARRANAIILLDKGWNCAEVAEALLIDDDTVRSWHKIYDEHGLTGLVVIDVGGSHSRLSAEQEAALVAWVGESLPRSTRVIGEWVARSCGIDYSHAGLLSLLHRLGLACRKPDLISRKIDVAKQKAFIKAYGQLLRGLGADEAVLFADAVHPTRQVRAAGCWAPKDEAIAITPSSGRDRLNIHGVIDLETGRTRMVEVLTVDAKSTIALLTWVLSAYPSMRVIHVFLDNARYHHARLVQQWLAQHGHRIRLHFVPSCCPHLNPIERLWGLMHANITHNRTYPSFRDFAASLMEFLTRNVPKNWPALCDKVSDNFRIINPTDFRVVR